MAHPVRGQEVVREQRDVFGSLAQRRHVDRHDPEAVVEVFPHVARGDGGFWVAVGRGDEPHIDDGIGRLAAHAAHHTVLNDPQELGLDRLWHLGQLVEKQRAAVRGFEQAGFVPHRAGECSLAVSEHLGFEQPFRQRRAVDGDERAARATAVVVRSEEHTSELQSLAYLVCRLLLEKKKNWTIRKSYPRAKMRLKNRLRAFYRRLTA